MQLAHFCQQLENSVIETVENGKMTKDLALCISLGKDVPRSAYRTTTEFLNDVAAHLDAKLRVEGRAKL